LPGIIAIEYLRRSGRSLTNKPECAVNKPVRAISGLAWSPKKKKKRGHSPFLLKCSDKTAPVARKKENVPFFLR
jgi:hypothetical protein